MKREIQRTGNKARSFEEAARWEREERWKLSPIERLRIARELQLRVYGADAPDVRESERNKTR